MELAIARGMPCIVVVCNTDGVGQDCGNCKRIVANVLGTSEFLESARRRGWHLVYLQKSDVRSTPYKTNVVGGMPWLSVYDNGRLCGRRVSYSASMDAVAGMVNLIQGQLDGRAVAAPAPKPVAAARPWWQFWK
jgi:hypothetical protein